MERNRPRRHVENCERDHRPTKVEAEQVIVLRKNVGSAPTH